MIIVHTHTVFVWSMAYKKRCIIFLNNIVMCVTLP